MASETRTGSAIPARNPRMLNGSAASVVNALAMRPARMTRSSAVVSNGTIGRTTAPPTPHAIATRVTVARTPVRTTRALSRRRADTAIGAARGRRRGPRRGDQHGGHDGAAPAERQIVGRIGPGEREDDRDEDGMHPGAEHALAHQPLLQEAGEVGADAFVRGDAIFGTVLGGESGGHGCYMVRYDGKTG